MTPAQRREGAPDPRWLATTLAIFGAGAALLLGALLSLAHGPGRPAARAVPAASLLISTETTIHSKLAAHDKAAKAAGRIECSGTGSDGDRVQAVYAHPAGAPDHLGQLRRQLNGDARWADGVFATSAAQTGGTRHIRWATTTGAAGCSLSFLDVTLTHGASTPFGLLVSELAADGLASPSRHYLVWVDENAGCGRATLYLDNKPGSTNLNNVSTGYAVAFRPCWDDAEPHELSHTFGGVQPNSPHGTGSGHCYDGPDVMCGPGRAGSKPAKGCSLLRLDCGHNDYFSTRPTGWLAAHWNAANSSWLYGGLPSPPSAPAPSTAPTFAANPAPASGPPAPPAAAATPSATPSPAGLTVPLKAIIA